MSFGSGALPAPTKDEADRIARCKRMGCVACRQEGLGYVPAEYHHFTVGDKHGQLRQGHGRGCALCTWHHQGKPPDQRSEGWARKTHGPSLARQPTAFRRRYGSDDALQLKQDRLLRAAVW